MSITIDEALSWYESLKESEFVKDRVEIVVKALEFYRDHAQYHPHKYKAADDEEFVAWLTGQIKRTRILIDADVPCKNRTRNKARLDALMAVCNQLGVVSEPGKPAPVWTDEIRCPWCGKDRTIKGNINYPRIPPLWLCPCGKLYESEHKERGEGIYYRTHKIGRIE